MDLDRLARLEAGYEEVADEYVRRIYEELAHKPLDRKLLDAFAEEIKADSAGNYFEPSPVLDVGCGPGHVALYLQKRGVEVEGLDLTYGMLAHARRLNPEIRLVQGDLTALPYPDGTWAGIVAFYSLIHVPREEMVAALGGLHRALRDGGILFMAFHVGDGDLHVEDLWGHAVSLDFFLFSSREMEGYLRAAGFTIAKVTERDPYPDVEYPSRRSYILSRKMRDGTRSREAS